MSKGYEITVKEHAVAGGILVANNTEWISVPELINWGILAAICIQLLYTLWKWRRDYKNHQHRVRLRRMRLNQYKKEGYSEAMGEDSSSISR